jgi:hypothetical protein
MDGSKKSPNLRLIERPEIDFNDIDSIRDALYRLRERNPISFAFVQQRIVELYAQHQRSQMKVIAGGKGGNL